MGRIQYGMRSMELHFGVIREKEAMHAALHQSKLHNRYLAVCFNSEGKLIVRICTVINIEEEKNGTRVTLRSQTDEKDTDFTLLLSNIQSIYPIRDFKVKETGASGDLEWPDDPEPSV